MNHRIGAVICGESLVTASQTTQASFDRAVAADSRLRPIVRLVDALCALVGPDHEMCAGCIWDGIVKPLVSPLVGWGRGYPPDEAKDPEPYDFRRHLISASEILANADENRVPATTETERWLRTREAYDGFTDVLLDRLNEADPANGHGIGWLDREAEELA